MATFFRVNSAKTLIWSFSLFWGILGVFFGHFLAIFNHFSKFGGLSIA